MDLLEEMNDWTQEEATEVSPEENVPFPEENVPFPGKDAAFPEENVPFPGKVQAFAPEETVPAAEGFDLTFPGAAAPARKRPSVAVWILVAMAVLSAALLGLVTAISLPYITAERNREEPAQVVGSFPEFQVTEAVRETILEPTISETAAATIPPARNPYDRYDFQYDRHNYLLLQNAKSSPGVDVSLYQGDIDWKAVRASGIEFAMIRLGVRGYGKAGNLREDEYAKDNLREAAEAGLRVGAYFYSQALTIQETDEEIDFMLEILGDTQLTMPLVLDWEIPNDEARTVNMDAQTLMDIQRHFCARVKKLGYTPMIYFNWGQQEKFYDLHELEEYPFWLALYQDRMTYPWKIEMWQWTDNGRVPGINGPVDLNVYLHY